MPVIWKIHLRFNFIIIIEMKLKYYFKSKFIFIDGKYFNLILNVDLDW